MSSASLNSHDSKLFWKKWIAHRESLSNFTFKLAKNVHDSEDLLSMTMLKAHKSFSKSKIKNFHGWISTIARNCFIDNFKRSNKKNPLYLSLECNEEKLSTSTYSDKSESLFAKNSFKALLQLKPEQKWLIQLFYIQKKSCGEISTILEISELAVRKRLEKARHALTKFRKDTHSPMKDEISFPMNFPLYIHNQDYRFSKISFCSQKPCRIKEKILSLEKYCLKYCESYSKQEELAELYFIDNQFRKAERLFQKVWIKNRSFNAALRLIELYEDSHPEKALSLANEIQELSFTSAARLFSLAQINMLQKNYPAATVYLAQALNLSPKNNFFRYKLIQCFSYVNQIGLIKDHITKLNCSELVKLAIKTNFLNECNKFSLDKVLSQNKYFVPALVQKLKNSGPHTKSFQKLCTEILSVIEYSNYCIDLICKSLSQSDHSLSLISEFLQDDKIPSELRKKMFQKWLFTGQVQKEPLNKINNNRTHFVI